MKKLIYVFFVLAGSILFSCQSGNTDNSYKAENPNLRRVVVEEVVQTPDYTYVKMKEGSDEYWAAVTRTDNIKKGGTYYYDKWMVMTDFKSKALDKTFKTIYFIEKVSDKPYPEHEKAKLQEQPANGSAHVDMKEVNTVEPAQGGISIATLMADLSKYNGKTVIMRGHVVKYTPAVMNKNWVHIQDGTQANGKYDLAVTTDGTCKIGDIVTFEGKIILDKDFGYGYKYDVLMENAKLIVDK